jgi:hypothetical protein
MQRALLQGASTAEAARFALEQDFDRDIPEARRELAEWPASESVSIAAQAGVSPAEACEIDGCAASVFARRLSKAALTTDVGVLRRILAQVIGQIGAVNAWQAVIRPVLKALASPGGSDNERVQAECLFSECVLAALIQATPILPEPRNQRPILLSCVPEERWRLSLYALAAALAERGIESQLFGTPMPSQVLNAAVKRGLPAAVVLLSTRKDGVDADLFRSMSRSRYRGRLFAYGRGWRGCLLPSKVEVLPDIATAADRVEHVLVGHPGSVVSADQLNPSRSSE